MPRKPKRRAVIVQRDEYDGIDMYRSDTGKWIAWATCDDAFAYFGIEVEDGEAPTLLLNPPRVVRKKRKSR